MTTSQRKPTASARLDRQGAARYVGFRSSDADILALADEHTPSLVAIDAPLSLPTGMDCLERDHSCESVWPFKGRKAEREAIQRGISIYVLTKRTFIKAMVYRGIELADSLRERGHGVIDVYPYASKVCLFGKPIPKKNTREGRRFLRKRLAKLVPGVEALGELDHDRLDALLAAYTAYLSARRETVALGLADEGQIVVPAAVSTDDRRPRPTIAASRANRRHAVG